MDRAVDRAPDHASDHASDQVPRPPADVDIRTPADLLRRVAAADPDALALVDATNRLTRAELDARVDSAAAALRAALPVPPVAERVAAPSAGERVALQLPTGADFVVLYLAALRAGLVAVPIDPSYTPAEVAHILADCGAALHLDAGSARTLLAGADPAARADASAPSGSGRGGEDVVAVLYTSGTSGRGKGAMLTARALLANIEQVLAVEPPLLASSDVVFVPVPLSHILGLNAGVGAALRVGATLVLADTFDPATTLATMAAEGVTTVLGVPGQYAAWLSQPGFAAGFASVRFAMSGSTRLGRGLVDRYADAGVPLHDGYGLTETAPVVALSGRADDPRAAAGTVGRPLPGIELELRDLDGDVADDGDPGRIFVRGPNLFSGYWPDGHDGPGEDGWFGTGDIAVLDDAGRLRLVGRTTDLVIVNGFNVYPAEVETVLAGAEGVAEAAVVGVPDERTGEAVRAFVVPVAGSTLDPAALRAHAAAELARFKVPADVEIVATLPHTVTGKVKKWQLDAGVSDAAE